MQATHYRLCCGLKIAEVFMSLRCAACGSKRVIASTKREGYDLKKGAVGAVLFGAVGAVAGAYGNENTYYHCLECGQVLPRAMYDFESNLIDLAISNKENKFEKKQLAEYKQKYPNIEWDPEESSDTLSSKETAIERIQEEMMIYLRNVGTLVEEDKIEQKYKKKDSFYDPEYEMALKKLLMSGRVSRECVGSISYFRLVTDVEEIKEKHLQMTAIEIASKMVMRDYEKYETILLDNVEIGKKYTKEEITSLLKKFLQGEVKSDNPYVFEPFCAELLLQMRNLEVLSAEEDMYILRTKADADSIIAEQKRVAECQDEACIYGLFTQNKEKKYTPYEIEVEIDKNKLLLNDRAIENTLDRLEEKGQIEHVVEKGAKYFALAGQIEIIEKTKLYESYLTGMQFAETAEDYNHSAKSFESLGQFKDAAEKAAECRKKSETLEAEAQAKLIEEKRNLEIEIEKEKERDKKLKKIAMIVIPIICILVAIAILAATVLIPNSKYNDAVALMDAGKYEEAYDVFVALDGHKDSAEKAKEAKYKSALAWINERDYVSAYESLTDLGDYKDSAEKAKSIYIAHIKQTLKDSAAGDIISFGLYEQDNDETNGKEAIGWRVLDKTDQKVLVVSEIGLGAEMYDYNGKSSWKTCTLRQWLNYVFIEEAFSDEERGIIAVTPISWTEMLNKKTTKDQIFILSGEEAEAYFASDADRKCQASDTLIEDVKEDGDSGYRSWWLRTGVGYGRNHADLCGDDGRLGEYISPVQNLNLVRPAMWIEIN